MDTLTLTSYAFNPTFWLVVGTILLLLELLDGSLTVFLPSGIGGVVTALVVKLHLLGYLPELIALDSWDETLIAFATVSLVAAIGLRVYFIRRVAGRDQGPDINQY